MPTRKCTIAEYRDRLKKLGRGLDATIRKPMRISQQRMRDALIGAFWGVDFGARIWEWRRRKFSAKGGPSVRLGGGRRPKYARYSASERAFVAPVTIRGMAADIELGGGRLRRQVFWGRGERKPGVPVPRQPVARPLLDKYWEWTTPEIVKEFDKFAQKVL